MLMCHGYDQLRNALERAGAAAVLLAATPVIAVCGICLAIESGRPVLFRQTRVGLSGKPFTLFKLRSMRVGVKGAGITAGGDPRITRVGTILRRFKLDELPQLWNVLKGDMQLIGPRPEAPEFVDLNQPIWRSILAEKPGITDLSTLVYRNEEAILADSSDPERAYREKLIPDKARLSQEYRRIRNWRTDLRLLALTVRYSFYPAGFDPAVVQTRFMERQ